jgi:hypothetical protein
LSHRILLGEHIFFRQRFPEPTRDRPANLAAIMHVIEWSVNFAIRSKSMTENDTVDGTPTAGKRLAMKAG